MIAYSYSRYSSDAQSVTSIERQQEMAREWCTRNEVELSPILFKDEGVSGYDGGNLTSGALGSFVTMVQQGEISRGSILLVENLDRLTRVDVLAATQLIRELVKTLQIEVVVLYPHETRYTEDMRSNDLVMAILHMAANHEASAQKSRWGKSEWAKRFKKAREEKRPVGKRVSNWLRLKDDKSGYELNNEEQQADTVRRIFELCLDGHGSTVIAQTLNAENRPTFNKGASWGTSAVVGILKNRAAIGEYIPKDGGEAIPDYFPNVVSVDTFNAAQNRLSARSTGKVTKNSEKFNVWSKLVFCGACGSPMHIIHRTNFQYLTCSKRRYGKCEGSRNVRLDESEDIFKEILVLMNAMSLVMPDPDKIRRQLDVAEGALLEEKRKLAVWEEKWEANPESEAVERRVLASEAKVVSLRQDVERLSAELRFDKETNVAALRAKLDLTDKRMRFRANDLLHRLGVQVRIAEGYLVVQNEDAKAMFAVSKGKIGWMALEGDVEEGEDGEPVSGQIAVPNAKQADDIALKVKQLLAKPGGGFVYHGTISNQNGRGTWKRG